MTRRKGNLAQATRNTTAKDAMFDCNFVGQGREPSGTFVPSFAFYDRCPSNVLRSLSFQRRHSYAVEPTCSRFCSPVGMDWRGHGLSPDPDAGRHFFPIT